MVKQEMNVEQVAATAPCSAAYDPNNLLDFVKDTLGAADEPVLAHRLGIALPLLRGMRANQVPLGASILMRMAEITSVNITALRSIAGDRRARVRIAIPRGGPALSKARNSAIKPAIKPVKQAECRRVSGA
jgi:hypothetical protein